MADIFDEVGEDLRRDKLNQVWRKYGAAIIGIAVLIVLGVAGWRGYDYWQARQAAEASDAFLAALQKAEDGVNKEAADDLLAFALEAPGGYRTLARFRAAAEQNAAGDAAAALKSFELLAADGSLSAELRDLARVRAAYIALDTEDLAAVKARIEPLLADGNPWRHSAREVLAIATVKAGAWDEARTTVSALVADPLTPQDIRTRMQILDGVITAEKGPAPAATSS